jgi:hypothetical protein
MSLDERINSIISVDAFARSTVSSLNEEIPAAAGQADAALWVQVAAVLAAVIAAILALLISAQDRRNARRIAEMDRRAALRQSTLIFERDALMRLAENLSRGGSTDPDERRRMGTEALVLIHTLGPRHLPLNYAAKEEDQASLRAALADESGEPWMRHAIEAQLAVIAVAAEIEQLSAGSAALR